jgi:hypothetical protein
MASDAGQLQLTAIPRAQAKKIEYVFILDPMLGLMDVDFHRITEEGWKHMQSASADTTAGLVVKPGTAAETLQRALDQLATRGHYQSVQITIETT